MKRINLNCWLVPSIYTGKYYGNNETEMKPKIRIKNEQKHNIFELTIIVVYAPRI